MGPGILPETTVGKHNPPYHLQMPTKARSCKKEAICEHVQKRRRVLWAKAHLKWTVSKWKRRRVPWAKEEGDLPACHLHSVQNPAPLMVWGCISAYGLHVLEGTMNVERYIKVLEQHMLPSRWRVFQQNNAKPHSAAITTAWLRSRRVWVLNCPACSPGLSPIENIWHIIKQKIRQKRPWTLQQLEIYIRQEWDQITKSKLQKFVNLMPRRFQTVLKRRGDAAPWKHEKLAHFVHKIVKCIILNICYVIYVLLWIKCWLMWFDIFCGFRFFQMKNVPTFSEFRFI